MAYLFKNFYIAFTSVVAILLLGWLPLAAQLSAPSDKVSATAIPINTSFLASLTTPIVMSQAKSGDTVEAEAIQDVKQDHKVLLKKGSMLLGHVDSVEAPNASHSEQLVVIAFDRVKPKKGEEASCRLVIQALAPRSDVQTDTVDYANGRGIQGATQEVLPAGHASATTGSVNPLTTKSHGVQDLHGLELRERIVNGKHLTVLAASQKNIQLKKGTQLVMRAVSE
jgi:hypothetical protein